MTQLIVPSEATSQNYAVVGATTAFPFTFAVFSKADLHFSVNGVELQQTDFTLAGTLLSGGGYQGGTVNLNVAVANAACVLWRQTTLARTANFSPAASVPVRDIDVAFNRDMMIAQDARRDIGLAIHIPIGTSPAALAGSYLKLDANGAVFDDGGAVAAALSNAAAAAASAATASTAATSASASATTASAAAVTAATAATTSAAAANAAASSAAAASSTPAAITATAAASAAAASAAVAGSSAGNFRNRLINGDMRIDQRSNGASITPASAGTGFVLDRWKYAVSPGGKFTFGQNLGGDTPPTGFSNYLGALVASAFTPTGAQSFVLTQAIEGINTADLGWGTASARSITVSCQIKASVVGLYGASLYSAADTRFYPFTFNVPVANVWTPVSATIPGDTTGIWHTDTSAGLILAFALGVPLAQQGATGAWVTSLPYPTGTVMLSATAGATFRVTGVQINMGSAATAFEFRPYASELVLCQRYYESSFPIGTAPAQNISSNRYVGSAVSSTLVVAELAFFVEKRSAPTLALYSAGSPYAPPSGIWAVINGAGAVASATAVGLSSTKGVEAVLTGTYTVNSGYTCQGGWSADAEL